MAAGVRPASRGPGPHVGEEFTAKAGLAGQGIDRRRPGGGELGGVQHGLQGPAPSPSRRTAGRRSEGARSAPSLAASGVRWMAAGTLPEAPGHARPSVTRATRRPRSCSTDSDAGSGNAALRGMPLARGPWKRTTATKSRSSLPGLEGAARNASWLSNTITPATSTTRCSGLDRRGLDHRPKPRLPVSRRSPTSRSNGSETGRSIDGSRLSAGAGFHTSLPSSRNGSAV